MVLLKDLLKQLKHFQDTLTKFRIHKKNANTNVWQGLKYTSDILLTLTHRDFGGVLVVRLTFRGWKFS